jgi:hypothetical protein
MVSRGFRQDTLPTDGWGAAAVLGALMEGAAGVLDASTAYQSVKLTPRWYASGIHMAHVVARYPASHGYMAYDWQWHEQQMTVTTTGSGTNLAMTIPLPETVTQATVLCDRATAAQMHLSGSKTAHMCLSKQRD